MGEKNLQNSVQSTWFAKFRLAKLFHVCINRFLLLIPTFTGFFDMISLYEKWGGIIDKFMKARTYVKHAPVIPIWFILRLQFFLLVKLIIKSERSHRCLNIRAVHIYNRCHCATGPIVICDFSYWLRTLPVWLHLQGCNTYCAQIHSTQLEPANEEAAYLANLLAALHSVAISGDSVSRRSGKAVTRKWNWNSRWGGV